MYFLNSSRNIFPTFYLRTEESGTWFMSGRSACIETEGFQTQDLGVAGSCRVVSLSKTLSLSSAKNWFNPGKPLPT